MEYKSEFKITLKSKITKVMKYKENRCFYNFCNDSNSEILSFLECLEKSEIISDDNYDGFLEILLSIVESRPINQFDISQSYDFLNLSSEIFHILPFKLKEYVSELTTYLILQMDQIDRLILLEEYQDFFHQLSNFDIINIILMEKDD